MEKECDFSLQWLILDPLQRRAALPALDAARHLHYGFQTYMKPLDRPALALFDRPDLLCGNQLFPRWARMMDFLLPQTQFLITADDEARSLFPGELRSAFLPLPLHTETGRQAGESSPRRHSPC